MRVFGGRRQSVGKGLLYVVSLREIDNVCCVRCDAIILTVCASYDGLVDALPVVLVLASAPLPLKRRFSLTDGNWVVEIPFPIALLGLTYWWLLRCEGGGEGLLLLLSHFMVCCFLGISLSFLFLEKLSNDAVDGFVPLFLRHDRQGKK